MEHEGEYIEQLSNRNISESYAIDTFMKQGWAPSPLSGINPHPSIPYAKLRRE